MSETRRQATGPSWAVAAGACALSLATGAILALVATSFGDAPVRHRDKGSKKRKKSGSDEPKQDLSVGSEVILTTTTDHATSLKIASGPVGEGSDARAVLPHVARVKLGHLNLFLHWECSNALMAMGLFPNVQEISESVACLQAIDRHLKALRFADSGTTCVVVGDGVVPRTAALIAMRTKWRRVISIDPCLPNLGALDGAAISGAGTEAGSNAKKRPAAGSHAHYYSRKDVTSQRSKERNHRTDSLLASVNRLQLLPLAVEHAVVTVDPVLDKHVLVVLPHAHVVPEVAFGCIRLDAAVSAETLPTISMVQIPCCSYIKHDTLCGIQPDTTYVDYCICNESPGAQRLVRVWADVAQVAFQQRAVQVGDRPALTMRLVARKRGAFKTRDEKRGIGSAGNEVRRQPHVSDFDAGVADQAERTSDDNRF